MKGLIAFVEDARKAADDIDRSVRQVVEVFAVAARARETWLAGLWGTYYVRGGLDPAYASPEARDAEIQRLMRDDLPEIAAAFLEGWVKGHPEPVCACKHLHQEPTWDDDEGRWRRPVVMRWSWICPIDRHRHYAQALSTALKGNLQTHGGIR